MDAGTKVRPPSREVGRRMDEIAGRSQRRTFLERAEGRPRRAKGGTRGNLWHESFAAGVPLVNIDRVAHGEELGGVQQYNGGNAYKLPIREK